MRFLPVAVRIAGKKILVVGGGRVAAQKIRTLSRYTRSIVVVAPEIAREISRRGVCVKKKRYAPSDLGGVSLVYACAADKKLNARIASDARKKGIMVNVADDPRSSDFISPAVYKKGRMSAAVFSDGTDVGKTILWRDKIKKSLGRGLKTKQTSGR